MKYCIIPHDNICDIVFNKTNWHFVSMKDVNYIESCLNSKNGVIHKNLPPSLKYVEYLASIFDTKLLSLVADVYE